MRYAIIENGRVTNIAIAEPEYAAEQGWVSVDGITVDTGYFYADGQFAPNTDEINAVKAAQVRARRDQLLAESDWVVTKAVDQNAQDNLGIQIPIVWVNYRQELRDIPDQPGFPSTITWPVKP